MRRKSFGVGEAVSARTRLIPAVLTAAATAFFLIFLMSGLASAQYKFDRAAFENLVPADSQETIPVGTKINVHNWEKYKRFMPIGMQALFSGKYGFKLTDAPEYTKCVAAKRSALLASPVAARR